QEQRTGASPVNFSKEVLLVVIAGDGQEMRHQSHHRVLIRLDIGLFLLEHFQAGINQEAAKNVDNPVEAVEQRGPDKDHRQAHHQRPQHAPEKDAVLVLGGHLEVREDQQEDKEVVD